MPARRPHEVRRQAGLLGHQGPLTWAQEATGLRVQLPAEKPSDYAITLKGSWV